MRLKADVSRFSVWFAIGIAIMGASFGLAEGVSRLLFEWRDIWSYAHGYLIIPMAAWLILDSVCHGTPEQATPSRFGFGLLCAALFAYIVASAIDLTLGMQILLPIVVVCMLTAVGGARLGRISVAPIAMLYLAIPVWDAIIWPLQWLTTKVVTFFLPMSGIVAYIEGSTITFPSGGIEIADGCSGIAFFLVALTLSYFYGLNSYSLWRQRLILVGIAAGSALLMNWLRVYLLVVIADYTEMQHYLIAEDHEVFGWVLFVIMMTLMFWFAPSPERQGEPSRKAFPFSIGLVPASPVASIGVGIVVGIMLAAPAFLVDVDPIPETTQTIRLANDGTSGWRETDISPRWRPHFSRPNRELRQAFLHSDFGSVDIYAAHFSGIAEGSKLISRRNSLDEGWIESTMNSQQVMIAGTTVDLRELRLVARGEQRLVWYWFNVGGSVTSSAVLAKILEVPDALAGRGGGFVTALSASCSIDCAGARESMSVFLKNFGESARKGWAQ